MQTMLQFQVQDLHRTVYIEAVSAFSSDLEIQTE